MRKQYFRKISVICLYVFLFMLLALIPFYRSGRDLYGIVDLVIYGGIELQEVNKILLIAYYSIKLGVVFLLYSEIFDELHNIGRYIFTRTQNRRKWLTLRHIDLFFYTAFYWITVYVLCGIVYMFIGGLYNIPLSVLPVTVLINISNSLMFLVLANTLSIWIKEQYALITVLGVFFFSEIALEYSACSLSFGKFIFLSGWGRYAVFEGIGGVALSITATLLIFTVNTRIVRDCDIY